MDRDVVIDILLGISALIHLAPVVGALSTQRLEALYGIPVEGPDLAVLLRHRAVLFGLLAALLVWGILEHDDRVLALLVVAISDVAYAVLCRVHRDHNAALRRVLHADLVSIVVLGVAGLLLLR